MKTKSFGILPRPMVYLSMALSFYTVVQGCMKDAKQAPETPRQEGERQGGVGGGGGAQSTNQPTGAIANPNDPPKAQDERELVVVSEKKDFAGILGEGGNNIKSLLKQNPEATIHITSEPAVFSTEVPLSELLTPLLTQNEARWTLTLPKSDKTVKLKFTVTKTSSDGSDTLMTATKTIGAESAVGAIKLSWQAVKSPTPAAGSTQAGSLLSRWNGLTDEGGRSWTIKTQQP